jgi:hypothetical protein
MLLSRVRDEARAHAHAHPSYNWGGLSQVPHEPLMTDESIARTATPDKVSLARRQHFGNSDDRSDQCFMSRQTF